MLSATTALSSCSKDMFDASDRDLMVEEGLRSVVITGAVTDAKTGQPLEDITIHFKAYPKNNLEASPLIIDEVHTTSNGTYTINAAGKISEPLLCVLTAKDAQGIYDAKTNQVIVSWSGMSYDKKYGRFVVNDCTFQLTKAE